MMLTTFKTGYNLRIDKEKYLVHTVTQLKIKIIFRNAYRINKEFFTTQGSGQEW